MFNAVQRKIRILDGGTGEELLGHNRTVPLIDPSTDPSKDPRCRILWSGLCIADEKYHPQVRKVHEAFMSAGADIITVNNYGISPGNTFDPRDIPRYVAVAGRLAVEARENHYRSSPAHRSVAIYGSLPPLMESYRSDLVGAPEECIPIYVSIIEALSPFVDGFVIETISSIGEMAMALDAFDQAFGHIPARPVLASFTIQTEGKLRSLESFDQAALAVLERPRGPPSFLAAILVNCCTPESVAAAFDSIGSDLADGLRGSGIALGAFANALEPVPEGWTMADNPEPAYVRQTITPAVYAAFAAEWAQRYELVGFVGGCCGISPAHIDQLRRIFGPDGVVPDAAVAGSSGRD
ncbi:Homocysteine S-methyltransferase [Polychytrium aggregatum]|uniref:Homocysteine S-methyltransferase n=1 Tax=Polychytrium aggregatum TaxID=110093 RepID=UPI0022FEEDB7|nr:Homocysteine S-methyltransferase [Polychytrium aggregatum]KAI9199324.1 Homocysteine S-methyltransferase [Polychytrium aggregatum]